jgi:uncharacterized membrane protein YedE/YeeE
MALVWKLRRPILIGFGPAALGLGVLLLVAPTAPALGFWWLAGLLMGFILQRGRLCFASAFRDLFLNGSGQTMRAVLAGLMVATLGFGPLMARMVPDPALGLLPPRAHVWPLGPNVLVGGLLFGVGMVLAGGCVSGTLYRIGEGYLASLVTLFGILIGLEGAAFSWNWWWLNGMARAPLVWLPAYAGHLGAWLINLGLLGGLFLLTYWWEARRGVPALTLPRPPEPPALTFGQRLGALWQSLFGRAWPAALAGAALGLLNIAAFAFDHPLGVTGELAGWSGRLFGLLGLRPGPLMGLEGFAGCNLVAEADAPVVSEGFMLDAGLIFGAFTAAGLASEFKLRVPRRPRRYLQSLAGGILLGYGAGIALGCTIGAFFSAIPSLGLNGWLFGIGLLGGAWVGVRLIRILA